MGEVTRLTVQGEASTPTLPRGAKKKSEKRKKGKKEKEKKEKEKKKTATDSQELVYGD